MGCNSEGAKGRVGAGAVRCAGCGAEVRKVGYYRRYTGVQTFQFVGGDPIPAGKAEHLHAPAYCLCCDTRIPRPMMDWLLAGVRAKVAKAA